MVFPALVLEFSEVMSPVDRRTTVDLVAAVAGLLSAVPKPTVRTAIVDTATARRNTFVFISFSLYGLSGAK